MDTNSQNKSAKNKEGKNLLEWTVFTISLLLVLGILGYLGFKTFTHKTFPPDIEISFRPDPTKAAPNRYHVEIKNTGGATAEEVSIELVLEKDKKAIEKAGLTIAFVPQNSKREGWLNFSTPSQLADTIFARVISFRKP